MDIEVVKELITAFKEAELTKFSLKCDDFELKLNKEVNVMNTQPNMISQPIPASMGVDLINVQTEESKEVSQTEAEVTEVKKLIKSPMVGTFYSASAPGEAPFVTVGTKVRKGDVVCVVEAMKLMNEVEADEDGEVVEILVNNEEMVEYGQALFVLK